MPRIIANYKNQAKALIIKAGIVAFSKRGYQNTTMEEIAKEVGVTKGNLYHYFPSKLALLREIFLTLRQGFLKSLLEGLSKADSLEALTNAVDQIIDKQTPSAEVNLWFDLLAESTNDSEVEALLRTLNYEYLEAVKIALSNFPESERTGSDLNPNRVAWSIMFLLHGVLVNIKLGTPREEIRGTLREGIKSILRS
jgi:TetR/AcrR family transcriptional repressor of uid operon